MKGAVFLLVVLFAGIAQSQESAEPKPSVLILTTGGTIASRTDAPLIDGPELVQAVPQLLDYAEVRVEEFSVIGSSKMTPDHWLRLAKRINAIYAADPALAGIVITHGTDTMEETAFFLNLTVKDDRPVVLVGSMRSSNEVSADGPANLINGMRVVISDGAPAQGVLVVLNEDISGARDVWKTHNRRVQTFEGARGGHLGTVDPDGVRFYSRSLYPHTTASEFDVSGIATLPAVLVLSDFTGMDSDVVRHFGELEMSGLVVRTFAGGRMSAGLGEGLGGIAREGIPIVVTSRVPQGRIVSPPAYAFPAIIAEGLQDNKARILLMLALTRTADPQELQRIFDLY